MAATPSVKVIKQAPYKGGLRQWSNRYHFNGGTPADATHWHTLMDNIVTAEKAIYASDQTIVNLIGYAAGSDVPVASKTYTTVGTYSLGGTEQECPLGVAALVRYSTSARTAKNHPIYCFNYYHGVSRQSSLSNYDTLATALKTAMGTYASAWISGFSDGSITAVRASPNGALCSGQVVEEFLTHRDFPYQTSL
jgi:Zn-dependent M28 family amino/carboxypeptidase